ncbi:MAG: type II and III secretion system protein [Puniceicoccales bacterium]|jgi:general secretion pathway protein D|nr:type II and III secretion system protein [Puniceicoccales bacterium]
MVGKKKWLVWGLVFSWGLSVFADGSNPGKPGLNELAVREIRNDWVRELPVARQENSGTAPSIPASTVDLEQVKEILGLLKHSDSAVSPLSAGADGQEEGEELITPTPAEDVEQAEESPGSLEYPDSAVSPLSAGADGREEGKELITPTSAADAEQAEEILGILEYPSAAASAFPTGAGEREEGKGLIKEPTGTGVFDAKSDAGSIIHTGEAAVVTRKQLSEEEEEDIILRKIRSIIIPEIEFKEASFSHALEVLQEMAIRYDSLSSSSDGKGLNMVILGGNPDAKITLRLHDRSIERILRFIVKAAHYQYDILDGSLVFFDEKKHCELETRFFPISRGTVSCIMGKVLDDAPRPFDPSGASGTAAEEAYLKNFFQRAGIDFSGVNGSNMAFDGTQLVVTHTPLHLRRLKNILERYRETRQVEIETRFVEVQAGNLDEFALQWGFKKGPTSRGNTWNWGSMPIGGKDIKASVRSLAEAFVNQGSGTGQGQIVPTAAGVQGVSFDNSPPIFPDSVDYGAAANPIGNLVGVLSGGKLNMMIKALEQSKGSNMLCAPKVTVLSGKMASITIAQELRYPNSYSETQSDVGSSSQNNSGAGVTITAGRPEDFQTRNVGVEMSVIPTVEEAERINLKINPTVTEFEGFVQYGGTSIAMNSSQTVYTPSGFYQPIFSTRQIKTEVTIQDASTVVMGGLMREEAKEVKDKVPILGDLPLLGKLFRSHGETTQKKNLLIFVTAHILSADGLPLRQSGDEDLPPEASERFASYFPPKRSDRAELLGEKTEDLSLLQAQTKPGAKTTRRYGRR